MNVKMHKDYYWLPLLSLAAYCLFRSWAFPAHDFANYYFGGQLMADGKFNSWVYFPYTFNHIVAGEGYAGIFASFAPNTPFLALAFLPISFLPIAVAKLLFNLSSVLLFFFTLRRLMAHYDIAPVYVLLLPLVFFVPIKNQILFGQLYLVLFFLIGEAWLAYKKGRQFKVGFFLALAVLLKVFPVLLAFVFLFRKKYAVLAYFGSCIAAMILVTGLGCPLRVWAFYLESVLSRASNGEIASEYVYHYQSLWMFLKTMLVRDKFLNPQGWLFMPMVFMALMWAVKFKLLTLGYDVSRKAKMPLVALSYWCIAMIVLSPYGSTYTYLLLVFAFLALAANPIHLPKKMLGFALLFAVANLPMNWLAALDFPFDFSRLLVLLAFFAFWCSLFSQKIRPIRVALAAVLPFIAVLLLYKPVVVDSQPILGQDGPVLVFDFAVGNDAITYHYYDPMGQKTAHYPIEATQIEPATLRDNQIWWKGSLLTTDGGNKRKAIVVNERTLYYLSDWGRGIGFYTLRKLDLSR